MDRLGPHAMLMLAFLLAVVGFYTFATVPGMAQWSTTVLLMATGFGVIGAQVGITTLTSMIYPVAMRSTGLGWALGVGRVGSIVGPTIGGLMLATVADPKKRVPRLHGAGVDRRGVVALLAGVRARRRGRYAPSDASRSTARPLDST